MKLTKKSELVHKEEDQPVLEAEFIDEDVTQPTKSEINQNRKAFPLAYTMGKIVGGVGPFILGFFQNRKLFDISTEKVNRSMRKRYREGRRAKRRKN